MEREADRIRALGGRIVAVGPGSQALAERVKGALKLSYDVFADPGAVFGLFGFRRVMGVLQQSGTVIIDPAGVVRSVHRATNPADATRPAELLDTLGQLRTP